MKSYAEKHKQVTTNWPKVIEKYITKGLTEEEIRKYRYRASTWPTCAVGNQCHVIKRDEDGKPDDLQLFDLGVSFANIWDGMYLDINYNDDERRRVYGTELLKVWNEIETRVQQLILKSKK